MESHIQRPACMWYSELCCQEAIWVEGGLTALYKQYVQGETAGGEGGGGREEGGRERGESHPQTSMETRHQVGCVFYKHL